MASDLSSLSTARSSGHRDGRARRVAALTPAVAAPFRVRAAVSISTVVIDSGVREEARAETRFEAHVSVSLCDTPVGYRRQVEKLKRIDGVGDEAAAFIKSVPSFHRRNR